MKLFKDTAGRDWTIAVNVDSIKRVRDLAKIDLLDNMGASLVEKLNADQIVICDILIAMLTPQLEAMSLTSAAFAAACDGNVLDAACTALMEELINFFPPSRRQVIQQAMAKYQQVEAAAMSRASKEIDKMDAEAFAESAFGSTSTNSRDQ